VAAPQSGDRFASIKMRGFFPFDKLRARMTRFFGSAKSALGGTFAVDAETIFPAVVGLYVFESRVRRVAHLSAADVGESSFGELRGHAFVVPHPEVTGAAEDSGGDGFQSSWNCRFAKPRFLHEARAGSGSRVAGIDPDELFEVRKHEAKGATGTKIVEDISEGDTELIEGHVLEDMGAVDGFGGLRGDGETFDDVAVLDVFGIGREALFHQ
jgi:hypothetical protein